MSALRLFARNATRAVTRTTVQRFMASSVMAPVRARAAPVKFLRSTMAAMQTRSYGAVVPLPTLPETEERITQVLMDFDRSDNSKVTLDAHYIKDMGLDSLDVVEVIAHVEEEFDTEIPDHDAETLFTIRETAAYFHKHLNEFKG